MLGVSIFKYKNAILKKIKSMIILVMFLAGINETYAQTPQYSMYLYTKIWGLLKYTSSNTKHTNWDELFINHIGVLAHNPNKLDSILMDLTNTNNRNKTNLTGIKMSDSSFSWINRIDSSVVSANIIERLKHLAMYQNKKGATYWYKKELPSSYKKNNKLFDNDKFKTSTQESLLGVAKVWNVIAYFYFYKEQTRIEWDSALMQAINYITDTTLQLDHDYFNYRLSIQKLASQLNDCHTALNSDNILNAHYWGSGKAPISVKIKNHHAIISYVDTMVGTKYQIAIGDTVNEINTISIYKLIDSLREYTPCCYNNGVARELSKLIIRGRKDSTVDYKINNRIVSVVNAYYFNRVIESPQTSYKVNDSLAYINFYYIKNHRAFKKTIKHFGYPGYYIFDYTAGSQSDLNYLPQHFARTSASFIDIYYPDFGRLGSFKSSTLNTGFFLPFFFRKIPFTKIAILVNSSVQSHTEFITMALQTNPNIYTVGDTSASALADVRKLYLPGNIEFVFTANAAYYPGELTNHRSSIKLDYYIDEFECDDLVVNAAQILMNNVKPNFRNPKLQTPY